MLVFRPRFQPNAAWPLFVSNKIDLFELHRFTRITRMFYWFDCPKKFVRVRLCSLTGLNRTQSCDRVRLNYSIEFRLIKPPNVRFGSICYVGFRFDWRITRRIYLSQSRVSVVLQSNLMVIIRTAEAQRLIWPLYMTIHVQLSAKAWYDHIAAISFDTLNCHNVTQQHSETELFS